MAITATPCNGTIKGNSDHCKLKHNCKRFKLHQENPTEKVINVPYLANYKGVCDFKIDL